MQDDQAAQDAATLLASLATNHPEAMRGTMFTLSEDEPRRAGLNKERFEGAIWWLIEYGFVERDENLAFRIPERGRKPIREAGRDDPS